jgi:predicted nucleotidyltransferase
VNTGLSESWIQEIAAIFSEIPSIRAAVLFGSRAMGNFTPASDVDIALIGEEITLREQIRLSARLNENKDLLKYDVLRFPTITNAKLIEHIRNNGIVVYEREAGAAAGEGFSGTGRNDWGHNGRIKNTGQNG